LEKKKLFFVLVFDFWMWLQQVWRRKGGSWKEKSYFLF